MYLRAAKRKQINRKWINVWEMTRQDFSAGRQVESVSHVGYWGEEIIILLLYGVVEVESTGQEQECQRERKAVSPKAAKCRPTGLTTNGVCLKCCRVSMATIHFQQPRSNHKVPDKMWLNVLLTFPSLTVTSHKTYHYTH